MSVQEPAHRPAELAPFQREDHHRMFGVGDRLRHEVASPGRRRFGRRRAGAAAGCGAGAPKRHSGVEFEIASSSASISCPIASKSGVER